MQHQPTHARLVTLLAVGGLCLLLTGSAQAQQRGGGRRSINARSSSTASTGNASPNANSGTTTCPNGSAGTSSGTGTTGVTTTGTTLTGTTTSSASSLASGAQVQTTTLDSGTVSAVRTANNRLAVQWAGNTSNVKTVYVAVLGANRQVLQQTAISSNPVQASLSLASTARYFGVQVVYKNGTTSTVIDAIR